MVRSIKRSVAHGRMHARTLYAIVSPRRRNASAKAESASRSGAASAPDSATDASAQTSVTAIRDANSARGTSLAGFFASGASSTT